MPRPVSNPPNPWLSTHVEWLGEPPPVELQVFEETAKSILATNDSPDVPFRWSINPYRGCQHACAYCYARPGHQHLGFGAGTDFDSKIVVKKNAASLLWHELRRGRARGEWIAISGVTDPYQPLEASYELTRECLQICRDFDKPVGIVTKGALVRRDAELLAEIHERASAVVYVSIPFADAALSRAIEPLAPEPRVRFETLRALAEAGVPVGVSVSPVIPGLNEEQVPRILEAAAEAGATRAFQILLRLTKDLRPVFEERLTAALPDRAARVMHAYDEIRAAQPRGFGHEFGTRMVGAGPRWETIRGLFDVTCRRLGFDTSPRDPLTDLRPGNTSVQGELFEG